MEEDCVVINCPEDVAAGDGKDDVSPNLRYPYRTLPRLKSHVQPRFAIFNAGVKIENLRRDKHELLKVFNDYPSLVKVAFIYKAWRRIILGGGTEIIRRSR